MLVELAVGDAYGAGFEYAPAGFVREHNTLSGYVRHPRHGISPGCYTDDTQMSLALAETILADEPWTAEVLAERFVRAFKRDPREGYAKGFYALLQQVRDGEELLARIRPHSDKSGAAMRAAPVGLFPSVSEVIRCCELQAAITHNSRDGIAAAVAVSLTAHYFLYRLGPKSGLGSFLESHLPGSWSKPPGRRVGSKGLDSARAATGMIMVHNCLSQLLRSCVALTGDTDTVASIALACAACSEEVSRDLPRQLLQGLENGPYGRDYLARLDEHLLARLS